MGVEVVRRNGENGKTDWVNLGVGFLFKLANTLIAAFSIVNLLFSLSEFELNSFFQELISIYQITIGLPAVVLSKILESLFGLKLSEFQKALLTVYYVGMFVTYVTLKRTKSDERLSDFGLSDKQIIVLKLGWPILFLFPLVFRSYIGNKTVTESYQEKIEDLYEKWRELDREIIDRKILKDRGLLQSYELRALDDAIWEKSQIMKEIRRLEKRVQLRPLTKDENVWKILLDRWFVDLFLTIGVAIFIMGLAIAQSL